MTRADLPSAVALILARGGSKGIPKKNLQLVDGMTLVSRVARACVRAESLDSVYVYSDSPDILQEAERAGARAVERPKEISGDRVTSEETVTRFLLDHDTGASDIMLVQATSPFLRTRHVDQAVEALRSRYSEIDSVISVFPLTLYPGFLERRGLGEARFWRPYYPTRWRRQDFNPDLYAETGALYLSKRSVWDTGRRMGERCGVVEMTRWEAVEIDEPEDLEAARALVHVVAGIQKQGTTCRT